MLTELLDEPPQSQSISLSSEASSQLPNLGHCKAFANAANSILLQFYSKYPPTTHKPAILFLPTSKVIFGDDDAGLQILVVLRDQWERTGQVSDLYTLPAENLTETLPKSMVSNTQEPVHEKPRGDCGFDVATKVRPPWEIVVGVLEFGLDTIPTPDSPSSPFIGPSHLEDACYDRGRKRPRSTTEDPSSLRLPKIRRVGSPSYLAPSPKKHDEHACLTDSSPRTRVDRCYPPCRMRPAPEARLLACFHHLLNGATHRSWVSGAIIEAQQISLISCDRGGLVHSSPVDMRSPEGFNLLRDWILTLGSRSMEQWGYTNAFGSTGKPVQETEFDVPATGLHLSFGRLRYQQRGIFGRCTNVYDVTIRTRDADIDGVCKIAWPLLSRPNEHKLLEKVHAVDPIHTPVVHCAWDVVMELPSKRLQPHCTGASASFIEQRAMRITVMKRYQRIDNLEGADFLTAFIQIMKCTLSFLLPLNAPDLSL
jgi:Fungal protein kinase